GAIQFSAAALRSGVPQYRLRVPLGGALHGPPGRCHAALAQICPDEEPARLAGPVVQQECRTQGPAGRLGGLRALHPQRGPAAATLRDPASPAHGRLSLACRAAATAAVDILAER